MKSKQQRADASKPALKARLFVPLLLLSIILPVVSWVLASKGSERNSFDTSVRPGPWGDLEYVRIAIELPDHYIDLENLDTNEWFFAGKDKRDALAFLRSCGLSEPEMEILQQADWNQDAEGSGVILPDSLLWNLKTESRSKIYNYLAADDRNVDQYHAFAFRPERLEERLAYSGLSGESIAMFRSLLYPQESLLRFADVDIVLRKISSSEERMRFVKTVSRRSSLLVKLNITPETDIDELLKYWGGGGRSKDLRPLLESLSRVPGGTKIDIAHLLPPFVRQRLYTYPSPESLAMAGHQDCHWTSINFWSDHPRAPFASPEAAAQVVENEYFKVGYGLDQAQLGDIVFLQNKDGILIHSAVYIADDIVFTKNGAGYNQPWIYMKMEDMMPYYDAPDDTPSLVIYRRKTS